MFPEVCLPHCALFLICSTKPSNDRPKCPFFSPSQNQPRASLSGSCPGTILRAMGWYVFIQSQDVLLFLLFDLGLSGLSSCSSSHLRRNLTSFFLVPPLDSLLCFFIPLSGTCTRGNCCKLNSTILSICCKMITVKCHWVAFVANTLVKIKADLSYCTVK